ncbi:MAG: oxidoreductase [Planctomycetota bacterium]
MAAHPIRVGLLGFGGVAEKRHLPALRAQGERFRIAAVARGDANKLAEAKLAAGVHRGYADWRELAADPEIDAVLVASPNALHADQAVAALEAGKHVLCEKPPAMNAAEAARMAEAARKHRRVLRYNFLLREAGESRLAQEALEAGRLGSVYHVRAQWFRRRGYPTVGSWFTTRALSGGGVLADLGSHVLDRALWLLGYPAVEAVSAVTHARLAGSAVAHELPTGRKSGMTGVCDVEDLAVCLLRLAGGVSLTLECSFALNRPEEPFSTELLGDRAGLRLAFGKPVALYGEAGGAVTDTVLHPDAPEAGTAGLYERSWAAFARAIEADEAHFEHGTQGVALMRVLEAAYRSAQSGAEVRL